ncbi:MAG: cbb3-type cytochrome c oxidase subunit I [Bacteroidetes bacterium]|nr:cbb3-type cytochrome c oxidase subunit I [Bacteroidota bacterium]
MIQIDSVEKKQHRKLIVTWSITFLLLFPILIILGLLMRLNQGEWMKLNPDTFYALMTLHGLGMAGVLFSLALAALHYLIGTRYARLSVKTGYFVYFLVLIGVVGLLIATLIGKFGAGWYLLYPLPFKGGSWTSWSTGLSIVSLIILGVAWLIGSAHVVYALAKEYGGFTKLIGWQYLGKEEPKEELPAIVLITTISLVPGIMSFLAGAVFLIMNLLQFFEPNLAFDPLLLKNLVFFFGHTLVNITMYCGVGWVYTLLPEFTGREWKVNKVLVYSWNATFFFILFAYFHHLYMDFVQPLPFQYAGQIASYLSTVPATAITMFGVIVQFYHSRVKWSIIPITFLLGTAGWAIGGFAAVVDSTISINKVLHNTLWVPAHFHTYMLMGVVLFIFGFLYYLVYTNQKQRIDENAKLGFWLFVFGAYGFLLMFYLGGMHSVPRRFSDYGGIAITSTHEMGAFLARSAAVCVGLLLLGLLMMYGSLLAKLLKKHEPE